MTVDVIQLFTQPGFGGDLVALRLQSFAEGRDQRRTAGLAGRQALAGGDVTNASFDSIEFGDAAQAFGRAPDLAPAAVVSSITRQAHASRQKRAFSTTHAAERA